ncbi:hypothetical protein QO003_003688 [Arthrobacter silviterrae]|uniref:Lipoprotein n=1 Tax=Arthrobacter silviterrae TaxID=2026658 RepID=A0ABX0DGR7_9MICC|nr:hypothetical protein [Arthrobacter silviterrae]MDQ0279385.1 hypothetical protein [Arthrobacter silviterrae]NGN83417.1 hypothetical protein [Arthrobacter silviterrae]
MNMFAAHSQGRRSRAAWAAIASLALAGGVLTACAPASTAGAGSGPAAVEAVPAMAPMPGMAQQGNAGNGSNYGSVTASQLAFAQQMRLLWGQHMEWTRLAVVDFASGSAGFPTTAARLLKNQEDIGNAIMPFYGEAAGAQLTTLLKAHITDFVALFQAAKAGDATALTAAEATVYANAQQIADFLAAANPKYWPQADMRAMMKDHITLTITYGSDELTGQYAAGITVFDTAEAHMMAMADQLSTGIIGAFPKVFR